MSKLIENLWEAIGHHSAQIAETEEMAPGEKLLAAMRAVEAALGAQPVQSHPESKPNKETWLCLLCKSSRKGVHYTLDDGVTPCPNKAKAAQPQGEQSK